MTTKPNVFWRHALVWITLLCVASFASGSAIAVVTIAPSSPSENGTYLGGSNLNYWTQAGLDEVGTIPLGVGSLSSTVASPTTLAASATNYGVGTATGGHTFVRWNLTEAASAPHATEIEITFTINLQSPSVATSVTVYVETQTAGVSSPVTYALFYDSGGMTAPVLVNQVQELSQQCSALGTCP